MGGYGKKSLAFISLTSCKGCQSEFFDDFETTGLFDYFDLERLKEPQALLSPINIGIIEGNPEGEKQEQSLKKIRKFSDKIITIGACAHLGGVQSGRNKLPKKLVDKTPVKKVADVIKVDYIIPGCPINKQELHQCLMDIYWGKRFALPDLAVCFECRQNENECILKKNKPCLGPVTRMGCGSICANHRRSCLGCRGTIAEPNIDKMKEILHSMIEEKETQNILSIFGKLGD